MRQPITQAHPGLVTGTLIVSGGGHDGGMTTTDAVIADDLAYADAVETAVKAAAAYYAGGDSALDDDAYDRLVRAIAAWEDEHPEQVLPESPTGKVAGGAVEGTCRTRSRC